MGDYIVDLKKDLLEQFKGKKNIEDLMEVIGKQLNDVYNFFEQLRTERSLHTAVGKQLDGVGDIVSLSRAEASMLAGEDLTSTSIDDKTYRKYLIYKILKNTCNCTYYDIMKAIGMFWDGPPLKYTEDPNRPATIIFDFEAEKDFAEQVVGIPYVKAGGVGLDVRMHKSEDFTAYYGFAMQMMCTITCECNAPELNR